MAIQVGTDATAFTSHSRAEACAQAVEHMRKTLDAGGKITNIGIGFVASRAGGHKISGDDKDTWVVVTVVTDMRDVPMPAQEPTAPMSYP